MYYKNINTTCTKLRIKKKTIATWTKETLNFKSINIPTNITFNTTASASTCYFQIKNHYIMYHFNHYNIYHQNNH